MKNAGSSTFSSAQVDVMREHEKESSVTMVTWHNKPLKSGTRSHLTAASVSTKSILKP